ncbi:PREDICTED: uncharacterized protein LOC108554673 [Eufriesea mexicana]|uniref:uncharacterized protein LOC108554673 n=1 Tax=Eufriesea mexicana TaxID=516756 RepID=UPI00083C2383|nr:PREDICTED: uncharacterized protein LOC108554673 [Eufriesea mexicana]
MKYFVFVLFASLAFASASPRGQEDEMYAFFEALSSLFRIPVSEVKVCAQKSGLFCATFPARNDIVSNIIEGKNLMKDEGIRRVFCTIACTAQVQGTMIGNKINMPYIEQLIDTEKNSARMKNKIRLIMHECLETVKDQDSECEVAAKYTQCMIIKSTKQEPIYHEGRVH